jgi:hypothetical protein
MKWDLDNPILSEAELAIYPDGYRPGCLPRDDAFGENCLALCESDIPIIPREQWAGELAKITLRPRVRKIKDQGGNGSCASEATTQAKEVADVGQNDEWIELNPLSIYRITSGGRDGGSSIGGNLKQVRDVGLLPESYWPRSKGMYAAPPDGWLDVAAQHRIVEYFDIANELEFGSALLAGFPVTFGYSGHAICAVGLAAVDRIIYANSWGVWGDNGFGTLSFRSVYWSYGVYAIRTTLPRVKK